MKDRYVDATMSVSRRGTRRRRPANRAVAPTGRPDLDRMVKDNSTVLTFMGLTLGVFLSRKFFIVPLAVAAALFQDALRGVWGGGRLTRRSRSRSRR